MSHRQLARPINGAKPRRGGVSGDPDNLRADPRQSEDFGGVQRRKQRVGEPRRRNPSRTVLGEEAKHIQSVPEVSPLRGDLSLRSFELDLAFVVRRLQKDVDIMKVRIDGGKHSGPELEVSPELLSEAQGHRGVSPVKLREQKQVPSFLKFGPR